MIEHLQLLSYFRNDDERRRRTADLLMEIVRTKSEQGWEIDDSSEDYLCLEKLQLVEEWHVSNTGFGMNVIVSSDRNNDSDQSSRLKEAHTLIEKRLADLAVMRVPVSQSRPLLYRMFRRSELLYVGRVAPLALYLIQIVSLRSHAQIHAASDITKNLVIANWRQLHDDPSAVGEVFASDKDHFLSSHETEVEHFVDAFRRHKSAS